MKTLRQRVDEAYELGAAAQRAVNGAGIRMAVTGSAVRDGHTGPGNLARPAVRVRRSPNSARYRTLRQAECFGTPPLREETSSSRIGGWETGMRVWWCHTTDLATHLGGQGVSLPELPAGEFVYARYEW